MARYFWCGLVGEARKLDITITFIKRKTQFRSLFVFNSVGRQSSVSEEKTPI